MHSTNQQSPITIAFHHHHHHHYTQHIKTQTPRDSTPPRCHHTTPLTTPRHDPNARRNDVNKMTTTVGCTKVHPFFYFLFYSTIKNLTTLTIPLLPEHDKHKKRAQTGASTGGAYKICLLFFVFYFNSNILVNLPPAPTTPENERDSSFSGCMTFLWPSPPSTTPENKLSCSFLGGYDLSLATTTFTTPENERNGSFSEVCSSLSLSPLSLSSLSLSSSPSSSLSPSLSLLFLSFLSFLSPYLSSFHIRYFVIYLISFFVLISYTIYCVCIII